MPTTPVYALPYPLATDPADVPTDLGKLANAVDAIPGLGYWTPYDASNIQDPAGKGIRVNGAVSAVGPFVMTGATGGVGGGVRYMSGGGGATSWYINAATGGNIYLAIGETAVATIGAAVFQINQPLSFAGDTILYRNAAGQLRTDGQFITGGPVVAYSTNNQGFTYAPANAPAGYNAFSIVKQGDAQFRWQVSDSGTIGWGLGGSTSLDTNLYRYAPSGLATDGYFRAGANIIANQGLATQVYIGGGSLAQIAFGSASDTALYRYAAALLATDNEFHVRQGTLGQISIGTSTATPYIYFGNAGDTTLYRVSAGNLRTDGTFQAAGSLVASAAGAGAIYLRNDAGHIYFGVNDDTTLYRLAAGILATPGSFIVGGNAPVSAPLISAVVGGNDLEWGHANAAGYRSTLGAETTNGRPFVAFNAEAGTNAGTYRTRGIKGAIIGSDLAGGINFYTLANANADNQAATQLLSLSAAGTLIFQGDTNLYRSAAANLKTDGYFRVGGTFYAGDGGANQIALGGANPTIYFGLAQDTTLYRSGAGTLTTPGTFIVGASAQIQNNLTIDMANTGTSRLYLGGAFDASIWRGGAGELSMTSMLSIGGVGFQSLRYMGPKTGTQGGRLLTFADFGVGIDPSSAAYSLDVNGAVHAVSFPVSSDERLKTAIAPLKDAVAALKRIRAISFEWDPNHATQRSYPTGVAAIGVTAQSVRDVYPELVSEWNVTEEGPEIETVITGETRLAVDYGRLVAPLIAAIGELDERLGALEAAT